MLEPSTLINCFYLVTRSAFGNIFLINFPIPYRIHIVIELQIQVPDFGKLHSTLKRRRPFDYCYRKYSFCSKASCYTLCWYTNAMLLCTNECSQYIRNVISISLARNKVQILIKEPCMYSQLFFKQQRKERKPNKPLPMNVCNIFRCVQSRKYCPMCTCIIPN